MMLVLTVMGQDSDQRLPVMLPLVQSRLKGFLSGAGFSATAGLLVPPSGVCLFFTAGRTPLKFRLCLYYKVIYIML
jgi:hypothetical protein